MPNLRICIIADGQSPHCQNWIRHLVARGYEVHLITTFPVASGDLPVASLTFVPLDFSARLRSKEKASAMGTGKSSAKPSRIGRLRGSALWRSVAAIRNTSMPLAIAMQRKTVRQQVERIQPDLVHAMRITFEGILAAQALQSTNYPLVGSVWGNDFTLYAAGSQTTGNMTHKALQRMDGLHPDCYKDLRLAREMWGFDAAKPAMVAPGNGGLDASLFHSGERKGAPVIVNPRGIKPYIRNDCFFQAIPTVLKSFPDARFKVCSAKGKAMAEDWVARLDIAHSVELLDPVSHSEMAAIFATADIVVSPSEHDGTPNTLLEAMASGAFPVAGNIESVREWVEDGKNGLLFDPSSPTEIATQLIAALSRPEMRERAATSNRQLVLERADRVNVGKTVDQFYQDVIAYKKSHA